MTTPLALYHAECMDGFASAWIAHGVMPGAEFVPVNYGEPVPDVKGRDVYILDFSYKLSDMANIYAACKSLVVLDHHKTAQAELANFGGPKAKVVFDMTKSGGRLTWEGFHPNQPSPWLVDYTEDRDLWRWKLPYSKEVSAALVSYERTFERWDGFNRNFINPATFGEDHALVREGAAILRYQAQLVEAAAQNAVEREIDGHKVLTVNTTCLVSEIGERLAKDRPFAATFFIRGTDGKKVWSLRSREGGIDVSEIAKRHGGGGHKQAAGYED